MREAKRRHLDKRAGTILGVIDKLPPDRLLGVVETSELLGVSESFLTARRVDGQGPVYCRLGRLIKYRVDSIREWVAGREHARTSEYRDAPSIPKGGKLEQKSHGAILHWPATPGCVRRRSLWTTPAPSRRRNEGQD